MSPAPNLIDEISKKRSEWHRAVYFYMALNIFIGLLGMSAGVIAAASIFENTVRTIAGIAATILAGILTFVKPGSFQDRFSRACALIEEPYNQWRSENTADKEKVLIDAYTKAQAVVTSLKLE
jgi:cytochrome c biogenesis protein CcdA